jgi:hypothetical protein
MTAADVRAEHEEALRRLTPEQRQAIFRLERASQQTNFNGRHWRDNLQAIFETEALKRSTPNAGEA